MPHKNFSINMLSRVTAKEVPHHTYTYMFTTNPPMLLPSQSRMWRPRIGRSLSAHPIECLFFSHNMKAGTAGGLVVRPSASTPGSHSQNLWRGPPHSQHLTSLQFNGSGTGCLFHLLVVQVDLLLFDRTYNRFRFHG